MTDVGAFVRGSAEPGRTRNRWLGPVLAVAVLAVAGLLTLQPPDTGEPYDPASTGPTGLRGLLDVLRELGVEVTVTNDIEAAAAADTVLVPPSTWPLEEIHDLARQGSRVVAQVPPSRDAIPSPLGVGGIGLVDLEPSCELLADVRSLRTSQWPGYQPDAGTDVTEQCIVRDRAAWLNLVPLGAGELVSVSTMAPLVNERLVDSDAGLAGVRLLAPTGSEDVAVLTAPPGTPPPTLFDLIDPRWFDAAWLTLAVLVALGLAQGRRLGRPVDEQLPVRVPSGELARAIGDLRHRAGHDARAARELRARTLAHCRRHLGLPPSTDAQTTVDELRARGVALPPGVVAALTGPLPEGPEGLVATARGLAELRATLRRRTADRTDNPAAPPNPTDPPDPTTPTSATETGRQDP